MNDLKCLWVDFKEFLFPRTCIVCDGRLSVQEKFICVSCLLDLPRTLNWQKTDNDMEQAFWGRVSIVRAAALLYYQKESPFNQILKVLKYREQPELGELMGKMMGHELTSSCFFDSIDCIVPIPLSQKRLRERGYNQSEWLARGLSQVTNLPVQTNWIVRRVANETQTRKDRMERAENVENIFSLTTDKLPTPIHLLLVDDVFTTGSTILSCASELSKVEGVTISVLTLAQAH